MPKSDFVLQSEIERITGFSIEKLRKWRQRFGFPLAEYQVDGRAIYSRESVDVTDRHYGARHDRHLGATFFE